MKIFINYIKNTKSFSKIISLFLLSTISVLLSLPIPYFLKYLLDDVIKGKNYDTYIGVKTDGPKFQLSEWKSTMINESVASALSIAYTLGGNEFAQEVDNEIINLVEDEAREYLNQLKISNPILFNKLCQVS